MKPNLFNESSIKERKKGKRRKTETQRQKEEKKKECEAGMRGEEGIKEILN